MGNDKNINLLFSSEYAKNLVIGILKKELNVHHNKIHAALKKVMAEYAPPSPQDNKKESRRSKVTLVKRDIPKTNFSVYNGT